MALLCEQRFMKGFSMSAAGSLMADKANAWVAGLATVAALEAPCLVQCRGSFCVSLSLQGKLGLEGRGSLANSVSPGLTISSWGRRLVTRLYWKLDRFGQKNSARSLL